MNDNPILYLLWCSNINSHLFKGSFLLKLQYNNVCSFLVHSLSHVQLFPTSWTAAHQASLSITNSQSLLKLMFIESVMSSNHLILCHPLLLLPSIFPSIRIFSNESVLRISWPKYHDEQNGYKAPEEQCKHILCPTFRVGEKEKPRTTQRQSE